MSPGNDERRPGEGRRTVELTGEVDDQSTPTGGSESYAARMRRLDAEYVRQSFRRSWDPEVRRLRRLLREAS